VPAAEAAPHFQFADTGHTALAVSGGSDSVAMLRLAHAARREGQTLSVLTVDHRLRAGSTEEASWVKSLCAEFGVSHETLVWEGLKPKTGIQAKARQARYDLMSAWCRAHGAGILLTAHTKDDQAETVAMRMQRTRSPESLSGILSEMSWGGVTVSRPLLQERREGLRGYLRGVGQTWLEDPSNDSDAFERVRVRKALNGDAGLAELARESAEAARSLAGEARDWLTAELTCFVEGYGTMPRATFNALRLARRMAILRRLLAIFAGGTASPPELERLCLWLESSAASRRTLGGAVFAARSKHVLIGREWSRIEPVVVAAATTLAWDGRFQIDAVPGSVIVPAGRIPRLPRRADLPRFVQDGLPMIDGARPKPAPARFTACLR
jgi:tRNA(Ile)-lysidine synthase